MTLCLAFIYGSLCHFRTQLAALHFNENCNNEQSTTADGVLRFKIKRPKARKGKAVAFPITEEPTYSKRYRLFWRVWIMYAWISALIWKNAWVLWYVEIEVWGHQHFIWCDCKNISIQFTNAAFHYCCPPSPFSCPFFFWLLWHKEDI